MTSRILPRDEYGRLAGTELEGVAPELPPGAQVVVAEDGDRIVGCWAVFPVTHVEGLWIDPAYRKDPRVTLRLFRGMSAVAAAMGSRAVTTAAITSDVVDLLAKAGAVELPGRHFSMTIQVGG